MNAVFTIVAQNFLGQAYTLAESVRRFNPELDFFIFIADRLDASVVAREKVTLVEARTLSIPDVTSMSFKYDVTEFCTAIKPFCFSHLFQHRGYEKVLYFDPDICVYSSLSPILDSLDRYDVFLTPHYLYPEIEYSGIVPEGRILFAGIYNLGFIAIRKSDLTSRILQWWGSRLRYACYADKIDGFHVDQKWVDFLPVFCGDKLGISRHVGMNVAFWNLHERQIVNEHGTYFIESRRDASVREPLVFYHFSKSDPFDPKFVTVDHRDLESSRFRQYDGLYKEYASRVAANQNDEFVKIPYLFNQFDNGTPILKFHRRLYRRLLEQGIQYPDPFSTGESSFYRELKRSDLIPQGLEGGIDRMNERNFEGFGKKIRALNVLMGALKSVIGSRNYFLLTKFLIRYCRPENQTFLLKAIRSRYEFKNENI